jgi:KDO2-lipid IV(A) lauroyltransferase
MVIDQSPSRQKRLHFSPFLGQSSAYHTSAAYLALKSGCPLYVFEMKKPERGFYQIWMHEVDTSAYMPCTPETIRALTDHLADLLARPILAEPAWWLWSHNRWKHQPREGDTVTPVPQSLS